MNRVPILAIVGATAAGKSDLALSIAERVGGEIVNTDAMQVYRGMDIGTAKLPVDQRRGITHHLLDFLDITETASVADFQRMAREVIEDCVERGVAPVLVGGSALYTRAILDEFDFPGTDPAVRARWEAELDQHGSGELHRRLAAVAPVAAAKILPGNGRRIVRALEVIELTGSFTAELPEPRYHYGDAVQIGVDIDRVVLDQRIEGRVDLMWEQGLVDEVRGLAGRGLREGRTASRALGYRQVLGFLDGEITEDEARRRTVTGTRRFARKQDSWFRNDARVQWVPYDAPDAADQVLSALASG